MNSLIKTRAAVIRIVVAIALISSFAVAICAQQTDVQQQGKMYGEPGFRGETVDLDVVNVDVRSILSYITDQYGINFVIDKSVKETPVTVKVKNVPWNMALDSILQAQELGVQVNGNILRVADVKILASEGQLIRARQNNQLDTAPLETEFIRLNYARAKDGIVQGSLSSGTVVQTQGMMGGTPYSETKTIGPNISHDSAASGEGIMPIIQRRLSRRGSIEIDARSNSLIITDVPANLAAVKQLIAILDQPEPQVEIEARIVVASRSFSRDIGVQISGLVIGDNGGAGSISTLPGGATNVTQPNNNLFSSIPNTIIGLTTGIFGTARINMLISAGEAKGQLKVIATPRVTTLNNRTAEIKSGSKIPVTTIQPGSGVGGNLVATTEYVDVPLRLEITPQITDLGTVILSVVAENSSTAQIVGGAPPEINTQSMITTVTVPDGGTTVVGGVLFDDERESQDRTPGLASIPLLGNLFKRKGTQRNTNEILFFITPRISRPDYAATAQPGTAPKGPTIIQPVPMANPASNSSPVSPVTPGMFPSPGLNPPDPAAGGPIKP